MATEPGHIQISEFSRDVIPQINWMMEDLFCQYGVSIPYFMLDFDFPDYSQRPDWVSGYNFNLDWGEWGYWLPWFNELLGLLFDEAHLPRLTLPDLSPGSWAFFNDYTEILYDNMQRHYVYDQSGTFIKDEVIEGGTSGITGWYKWKDGDGYIHVANKSAADFEEEKIVGADSGAYAWTYEDYWVSPLSIYHLGTGGNAWRIYKDGESDSTTGGTISDAWDAYDAASVAGGESSLSYTTFWGVYKDSGIYHAGGQQLCLSFDTTNAPTGASSIILRIRVDSIDGSLKTPTVKLYRISGTFDTDDWDGGDYITSKEISTTGYHDITLSDDDINQGGITKLKFAVSEIDGTRPDSEALEKVTLKTPLSSYTRLIFTK